MIPGQEEWTLTSRRTPTRGEAFFYDEADDVSTRHGEAAQARYREYLTYEFPARRPAEATAELQVGRTRRAVDRQRRKIPTRLHGALRRELTTASGFSYQGYVAVGPVYANGGDKHLDQGAQVERMPPSACCSSGRRISTRWA